jgi:hypothetical protein
VGDRHWITGQAYPPEKYEHFEQQKVIEDSVDARAVYACGVDGEQWSVMLEDPPEEVPSHLSVEITAPRAERYLGLVDKLEGILGRTALTIFVY